ncbi:MAG: hypothetical protein QN120_07870 [Armatimonadota bacterium]|nr:hypothetical protein [Armatimonadota bacterium]
MTAQWPESWEGLRALVLVAGNSRAVILPDAGAKVASLVLGDHEVLWRNPHVPIRPAPYGARYRDWGASGIDICFPSIAPCPFPSPPWRGLAVPDHGEVWALPWTVEIRPDGAHLWVEGRQWPYRLALIVRLDDGTLAFTTQVENLGDAAFPYLWALHPAFPLTRQTRLRWPASEHVEAKGQRMELYTPGRVPEGFVAKVFAGPLHRGEVTLEEDRITVRFQWDPRLLPYLGVWISNEDETQTGGRRCIAVEPSFAPTDSLEAAFAAGSAPVVAPGGTHQWQVTMASRLTPAGA